jgi:predicted RNase H-like HicB family nuclease
VKSKRSDVELTALGTSAVTVVIREVREGFIGWIEEVPGVNVQEASIDEARKSLAEAVELVLAANRGDCQIFRVRAMG